VLDDLVTRCMGRASCASPSPILTASPKFATRLLGRRSLSSFSFSEQTFAETSRVAEHPLSLPLPPPLSLLVAGPHNY
jgi:hypothetical protein